MRVGLDLSFWQDGTTGGASTYALGLVSGLSTTLKAGDELVVFLDDDFRPALPAGHRAEVRYVRRPRGLIERAVQKAARLFSPEYVALVRAFGEAALDVVHFMSPRIEIAALLHISAVVTVHDLLFEHYPDIFDPRDLVVRRQAVAKSVQLAQAIATDSEQTRRDVVQHFPSVSDRIYVIRGGVESRYYAKPATEITPMREKYSLPAQYIYYPANDWPHKNHARLLEAWQTVIQSLDGYGLALVLTGAKTANGVGLDSLIRAYDLEQSVCNLGYLPFEEIPLLYAGAVALVYPSIFEGLGLPLLEAMACGCPVACSDIPVLREVGGEAVRYFDPYQADSIAQTIIRLVKDESARRQLVRRGIERRKLFTWEMAAQQLYEVYREAVRHYGSH